MTKKDENKVKAALARRDALTPEQRRSIAIKAAKTRHGLKATHKGNFKEEFGVDVECYVLDDEQKTAVISQRGMGAALGLGLYGGRLPRFIVGDKVAPYVGHELAGKIANPLIFKWSAPGANTVVYGYDVTILIDICKAILKADADGQLLARQKGIAQQAQVIVGASAKAGIKGLVYALAGYDATREEVIQAFKMYVQAEARTYESEFPAELYDQWYRLYDLERPEKGRTWKFKHLTLEHVYKPLANSKGKLLELTRAQKTASGDQRTKLHQFLSEIGVKALRTHLGRLSGIAEFSDNKDEYEKKVAKAFGKQQVLDV